jgi:anti-sigma B factor antagonist
MTTDTMQITTTDGAGQGQKIVTLKGPLNVHTVFGFHDAVRKDPPPSMILDFSAVPYIDSAGLGALVAANIAAQKTRRKLALAGINTQVNALMEMTHVAKLFKVYPTVHEAEVALDSVE